MRPRLLVLSALAVACGPSVAGPAASSGSSGSSTGAPATSSTAPTTLPPLDSSGAPVGSSSSSAGLETSSGGESSSGSSSTGPGCDPHAPRYCNDSAIFHCADGLDNDGDGLTDLDDPECLTICDDTEDIFGINIPPGWYSCVVDCYFDGNLGHGDDGCQWLLSCDPLDPGAGVNLGCSYVPGPQCMDQPVLSDTCPEFCEPRVPNGCDCFGCCSFEVDGRRIDRSVVGEPGGCSFDDLEQCLPCTSQMELCGNPCEPEACELCIGQSTPPAGCDAVGCVGAPPCEDNCDCDEGYYCMTGCCMPEPDS